MNGLLQAKHPTVQAETAHDEGCIPALFESQDRVL